MKKSALLLVEGMASLTAHAQVSGKTTNLNLADYDYPPDTNRVGLKRGDSPGARSPSFLNPVDNSDATADIFRETSDEPLSEARGGVVDEDDFAFTLDSYDLPSDENDEVLFQNEPREAALPTQAELTLPVNQNLTEQENAPFLLDEAVASVDAILLPDDDTRPGESWQYAGRRQRQFMQMSLDYFNWLARVIGLRVDGYRETGRNSPEVQLAEPAEAALAQDDLLRVEEGIASMISEELGALEELPWPRYRTPMGENDVNTASVVQEGVAYLAELDLVLRSGVTIRQRGDDQFVQVVQGEASNLARINQDGEDNSARLTQNGNDSSVEVAQLGANNSVTTNQTGTNNFADVEQIGRGQVIRLDQALNRAGEGGNNRVLLVQTGWENTFEGEQNGQNNFVGGLASRSPAVQTGFQNLTHLEQLGNGNVLLLRQEGDGQQAFVMQSGNKNTATVIQQSTP